MTAGSVYDQAVEVMARASLSSRRDTMGHMQAEDLHRLYMTAALDALLAVPRMIDCPTCGGTGDLPATGETHLIETKDGRYEQRLDPAPECPDCDGGGVVPGPEPLVLLGAQQIADIGNWRAVMIGTLWHRLELTERKPFAIYREGTPDES